MIRTNEERRVFIKEVIKLMNEYFTTMTEIYKQDVVENLREL